MVVRKVDPLETHAVGSLVDCSVGESVERTAASLVAMTVVAMVVAMVENWVRE